MNRRMDRRQLRALIATADIEDFGERVNARTAVLRYWKTTHTGDDDGWDPDPDDGEPMPAPFSFEFPDAA